MMCGETLAAQSNRLPNELIRLMLEFGVAYSVIEE